mmetsp:Transcript_4934/g.17917  ORF Transcript_4934/g.17917 Transcript_4934/m.17917 type:complete len:252 (+) Transcript_4934:148-903(+)
MRVASFLSSTANAPIPPVVEPLPPSLCPSPENAPLEDPTNGIFLKLGITFAVPLVTFGRALWPTPEMKEACARTGANVCHSSKAVTCVSRNNTQFIYPFTYAYPLSKPAACPMKDAPGMRSWTKQRRATGYHADDTSKNPKMLRRPTSFTDVSHTINAKITPLIPIEQYTVAPTKISKVIARSACATAPTSTNTVNSHANCTVPTLFSKDFAIETNANKFKNRCGKFPCTQTEVNTRYVCHKGSDSTASGE